MTVARMAAGDALFEERVPARQSSDGRALRCKMPSHRGGRRPRRVASERCPSPRARPPRRAWPRGRYHRQWARPRGIRQVSCQLLEAAFERRGRWWPASRAGARPGAGPSRRRGRPPCRRGRRAGGRRDRRQAPCVRSTRPSRCAVCSTSLDGGEIEERERDGLLQLVGPVTLERKERNVRFHRLDGFARSTSVEQVEEPARESSTHPGSSS